MKICHVNPGLISIPPNGWGAIEKIIWNYKLQLEQLNHQVDIKFHNEVKKGEYDIIHCHTANQSIELSNKGIGNIFTIHDHHTVVWGKDSFCFKQNLEAINKSILSISPGEFIIRYFDKCYKMFYLPHGVDNLFFKPKEELKEHKLLCVANNGLLNEPLRDRKGFNYAIEAAKTLNLPITIAGPTKNNSLFFKENQNLLSYPKLTTIYDANEKQLLELYQNHTIFLHPSEVEAGHPNLTLLEAMACGLPIVGTYNGNFPLKGLFQTSRNTTEIVVGLQSIIKDYHNYRTLAIETANQYDWSIIVKRLETIYKSTLFVKKEFNRDLFKNSLINTYKTTVLNTTKQKSIIKKDQFYLNFIKRAFLEIKGNSDNLYNVKFIDKKTNQLIYENKIPTNHWVAASREWFTEWSIVVESNSEVVFKHDFNCVGKNVYIHLDSKALGDTIAWFPYVEEFRKKHNCNLICSTFWNDLFEKEYKNIKFVNPGEIVNDLYAMYEVGIFLDNNKNPNPVYQNLRLQQMATDILGLKYKELIPKVYIDNREKIIKEKYVCVSTESTAKAKLWNNDNGWQETIDYLFNKGFKVLHLGKEKSNFENIINIINEPIEKIVNYVYNCEFFIGLSSGLSWLSWTLNKKTILISGFTQDWYEFKTPYRPINKNVCYGCYNDNEFVFDKGNWNWCPRNKDFECTKTINSQDVIKEINKILNL